MKRTQRLSERTVCTGPLLFLRIGVTALLFQLALIHQTFAQQDSTKKATTDTLITPAAKPNPAAIKPLTDTLPKKQTSPDSLSKPAKPAQTFDPLVKPTLKPDSTAKPAATQDSIPKTGAAAPQTQPANIAQPNNNTSPANTLPTQNAQTPAKADSSAATPAAPAQASSPQLGPDAKSIKGKVVDEKGGGMPGVSVLVKGTEIQSVTNPDGTFEMKIPAQAGILVYSFVGFKTQEIPVAGKTQFNIQLVPEAQALKEVVVVGYGAQSKRDLASSTSRISGSEYKSAVINTVDQALQGRTTGVQVVETSGEPGAASVVRIRGNNSLSGNNEPLYVIDGFPMPPYREAGANFTGAYTQNGLYGINPNDIESMEILKDASATAIYGSRGANGVVLITTKAGKRGEGRVELTNKTSFGSISNPIKMMNSRQYAQIINESYAITDRNQPFENLDSALTNTDWVAAITQPSFRQDVTLSVSGGSPKSSYYISGNYLKEKGTIINSDNNRASLRANLNNEVNDWYTVKSQLSFIRQKSNRAVTSSRAWPNSGGLMDGLRAAPTLELDYLGNNSMGIPNYQGYYFANPYNELTAKTDITQSDYSILNIENYFKLAEGLQLVVSLGGNQNLTRRKVFLPPSTAEGNGVKGKGSNNTANTYSYNVNAYFQYEKTFKKNHYLNTTLGVEYNDQNSEVVNALSSGYDIPYFGVDNIGTAQSQSIQSYKEQRRLQSAFLRANYSFKSRYVLNTSVRVDGASPFAANRKYGVFPSVALAWNLDQEEFMKDVRFVSNTKFRASYGETGSQAIGPYSSLSQYSSGFYEMGPQGDGAVINTGIYPNTIANPNLSWERTRQFNVGADFNAANDRLVFSFDYYNKITSDLLQPRKVPTQSGVGTIIDNYGTMRNRGVELSIQGNIVKKKNVTFSTRLNISRNINTLVDLGERTQSDYVTLNGNLLGGVSGILTPGQEVGRFFGFRVSRLTQTNDFDANGNPTFATFEGPAPAGSKGKPLYGAWIYDDTNGDNMITAEDRVVLGKSTPDFTFGWTYDLTWKNLAVNALFTGSVGNDVLNLTNFYINNGVVEFAGVGFNQSEDWFNKRYTVEHPHNNVKYPGIQRGIASGDINSTMLEDGSFVRLKMLSLSYTFPKFGPIKNPRLFVTGTNLWTLTKYTGFDPEVSSYAQSLLQQGIDYGAYPSQRSYTIGFSCNF
ncbi:SusC/RagA family TonB-linked outer membrane protein [Dyadobacter luticola]|uniref:SusC/RagA family TonB-linked outer membrane protein n=1 Tax=Dyadobacter luticola TaxID=1979387 RepID=A0A5R9L3Y7_9BACT|nr:SusC/RagA family TonB-linked outer membrane protein [Dyadobacter luticola]TLV03294.1 SusC/RagA family TonB-linked outer membrane protein [Dyadobacter luticola]